MRMMRIDEVDNDWLKDTWGNFGNPSLKWVLHSFHLFLVPFFFLSMTYPLAVGIV